jgi:FG-GAP repeat/Bacterial Ig-like domain
MKFNKVYFLTNCRTEGLLGRLFVRSIFLTVAISTVIIVSQISIRNASLVQGQMPLLQSESTRILASDPSVVAEFGTSVAVYGDTLVLGAPFALDAQNEQNGAVYIYVRVGSAWSFQNKLTQPDPSINPRFGGSVAIDGNTLVIGAPNDIASSTNRGSVYIFLRNGSNWTMQQKLIPSDGRGGFEFGSAVAVDGNVIAVGAFRGEVNGVERGSAYVFTNTNSTWVETTRLTDTTGGEFGSSISVSGNTIVVGSRYGGVNFSGTGFAYVYVRDANAWPLQTRLIAADTAYGDRFGSDVEIDGDTLLIGADDNAAAGGVVRVGAAYLFTRTNGTWTEKQKFAVSSPKYGQFGASVGISGDKLIIGDSRVEVSGQSSQGAAYVFVKNGPTWSLQNRLTASDGQVADFLGTDVAIEGNNFFVGAPGVDLGQFPNETRNAGAVYFFIQSPLPPDLRTSVDTGFSNSDNITNNQNLIFDINGVTPGAAVELLRNGIVVNSGTATQATFTLSDTPMANSTYQYTTRQINGGEVSSLSETVSVTIDTVPPVVWIEQGPTQIDPTNFSAIFFRLYYLENIVGFETTDISFEGSTANLSNVTITHSNSPASDTLRLDNVVADNQIIMARMPTGSVSDFAGNPSVSLTTVDNTITVDNVRPTLTINQSAGQADPTSSLPLRYTAVFSEPVTGFAATNSVTVVATPGNPFGAIVNVSGSGAVYEITVSNVNLNGSSVRVDSFNNNARDSLGNLAMGSTSTDNFIFLDNVGPSVSITLAPGQPNPTAGSTINYRVIFNEPTTEFSASDISLSTSTANVSAANVEVTGIGTTYNVAVSNFTSNGQSVRSSVMAAAVADSFGNPSTASSVTNVVADNTAPSVTIDQAPPQADPTSIQPVNFRVVFSESVTGLTSDDLSLTGSTANTSLAIVTITGTGTTYNVAVSNVISSGLVRASLSVGAATDALGNISAASQSTDNTVTLEIPVVADITGRVSNLSGRGLARVTLEVVLLNGDRIYTQTNPFGYYRLIGVPTGQITINVTRKNSPPASTTFYLLGTAPNTNFAFL